MIFVYSDKKAVKNFVIRTIFLFMYDYAIFRTLTPIFTGTDPVQ